MQHRADGPQRAAPAQLQVCTSQVIRAKPRETEAPGGIPNSPAAWNDPPPKPSAERPRVFQLLGQKDTHFGGGGGVLSFECNFKTKEVPHCAFVPKRRPWRFSPHDPKKITQKTHPRSDTGIRTPKWLDFGFPFWLSFSYPTNRRRGHTSREISTERGGVNLKLWQAMSNDDCCLII